MKNPLKPHRLARYVPQGCEIHSCKNAAAAFCGTMYIFVCEEHIRQYCIPGKHDLHKIVEALSVCAEEASRNAAAARRAAEKYDRQAANYQRHLDRLNREGDAK